MLPIVAVATLLNIWRNCMAICSNEYGSTTPCKTFLPSSPGTAPSCAKPGLTYCEYPTQYPLHHIEHLLQNWQYNYNTLLNNESLEEFHSYFLPVQSRHNVHPVYGPPNTINEHRSEYLHPPKQSYIPFNPQRHTYIPPIPVLHHNLTPEYVANKNWWKRPPRDLTKHHRSPTNRRRRSIDQSKMIQDALTNSTSHRTRRQSLSGQQLCQFRVTYIMPRAALNNQGNWMYIVNMPEVDSKYTQLVRSETCSSDTCSPICGLPVGYTSRCEQKYAQKRLVALESGGDRLYTDVFWFPSCCVCTVSR
ncbi:hypothetical protein RI129_004558 [Pyrocoelia pectoralis]|uniref:Spaetzle domain-containing protein n=1 Tax=Pyrocoelia pectoralis TaxID=417401 RepID=A0AAN7VL63_9COLE